MKALLILHCLVIGSISEKFQEKKLSDRHGVCSFQCGFCEFIIFTIYGYLSENSTEKTIIQTVDSICDYVPASYASLCDSFIGSYGPEIIQLLIKKESPTTICTQIGICNSTSNALGSSSSSFYNQSFSTLEDTQKLECMICHLLSEHQKSSLQIDEKVDGKLKNNDPASICSSFVNPSFSKSCSRIADGMKSSKLNEIEKRKVHEEKSQKSENEQTEQQTEQQNEQQHEYACHELLLCCTTSRRKNSNTKYPRSWEKKKLSKKTCIDISFLLSF